MVSYINAQLNDRHYIFDPIFELQQGQGLRERIVDEVVDTARGTYEQHTISQTNIRLTREVF